MGILKGLFQEPLKRTPEAQAEVDRQTTSLVLYQFKSCPYCIRVRRTIRQLALDMETRDINRNPEYRQALRNGGGKSQVPCLRIEQQNGGVQWLYESADIIAYLKRRFSKQS